MSQESFGVPQAAMVVGVVADTHIPDRIDALHPDLLPLLRDAGVQMILHAGDICAPFVIRQLSQVAPVVAVRGNRDWAFWGRLPMVRRMQLGSVPVVLLHGHGQPVEYLWTKLKFTLLGYQFDHFAPVLRTEKGAARAVIFGHTHFPENRSENGCLFFNPGSASYNLQNGETSFGLLRIDNLQQITGEIVPLRSLPVRNRKWLPG